MSTPTKQTNFFCIICANFNKKLLNVHKAKCDGKSVSDCLLSVMSMMCFKIEVNDNTKICFKCVERLRTIYRKLNELLDLYKLNSVRLEKCQEHTPRRKCKIVSKKQNEALPSRVIGNSRLRLLLPKPSSEQQAETLLNFADRNNKKARVNLNELTRQENKECEIFPENASLLFHSYFTQTKASTLPHEDEHEYKPNVSDLQNSENTEIENKVLFSDMVQNIVLRFDYICNQNNALEVLNESEFKELCESVKTRSPTAIANTICQMEKLCNVVVKYLMKKIHEESNSLAISVNNQVSMNRTKDDTFENSPVMKYILDHSLRLHPAQEKLIEKTRSHQWAVMMSSSDQLQFLQNLVTLIGARRTIDVGTFTGYSALSIALVLPPDGKLVTCDITADHVGDAEAWKEAGVNKIIDFRVGPAVETLRNLLKEDGPDSFDFAYIDANKNDYDEYYELSLQLVRPKGIIAIDNVLWGGRVADPTKNDENISALRALNDKLARDPRINISVLALGDGTTLCFKN